MRGETQGTQGTVSSVAIEDKRRLLKSMREMKILLDRFNPGLNARYNIKSIWHWLWKTRFLKWEQVKVTCLHNLSLTIDLVDVSNNAWKGNVLLRIYILLAPVHTTLTRLSLQTTQTFQSYILRRKTILLITKFMRWGTGELFMDRVFPQKKFEIWVTKTNQKLPQ